MTKSIVLIVLFGLLNVITIQSQDTFSIVAVDPVTGEVGSAGASCVDLTAFPGFTDDFLGELFPGVGAINTQAWYNQTNQINARNRMNLGESPDQIIEWLVSNDVSGQPQLRQYGIVAILNELPEAAAHTGTSTDDYKNHIIGPNYAIQGNILLGQEVLDAMEMNFLNTEGDLACKLMGALQGANMVGADSRCTPNGTSSLFSFIKVAQADDAFGAPSFVLSVRTADGDGVEPIDSLQTLFDNVNNCTVLGVNDNSSIETHFQLYPNPFDAMLTLEDKSEELEVYKVKILDITGSSLYQNVFQNNLEISMSTFQAGIYFIQISNDNESYVSKIIKY